MCQKSNIVNWLEENLQNEVAGSLITPESGKVIVETLYFDGPREGDWPAFGLGADNRIVLAFGKDLVFVPEVGTDMTIADRNFMNRCHS